VKLRRQGREFVGLSPFNKEKSPSFFVNDDKGFFHDFSSGKHGDLISFLQETERLTFVEAVERLAAEAGMDLPEPDPRAAEMEKERQGLADWLETAAAWFEAQLRRPVGQGARDYLGRRGLPEGEWGRFRIGYAPQPRTALKDYLITKGARPGDLVDAGLLISPEDGSAPYDRFRERIIFPITDSRGRVVSFGGRALDPNARAKYLNGPDTSLFDKGRVLYGLPEARRLLHAGGDEALVVVEGYMDVIACQRAGIAAVASMGTALTEAQMESLWRLHGEPTLSFDGDRAGRQAASRAIDRALPLLKPGRSFRFAIVSGGKDPDDVLREQGPAALKTQLSETTPFAEALFMRERDAQPLDTPERRAALKQRLRQAAQMIGDKDLAQAYRDDLLGRFDALFPREAPRQGGPRQGRYGPGQPPLTGARDRTLDAARQLNRAPAPIVAAVVKYALTDPGAIDDHLEEFEQLGEADAAMAGIVREIVGLRLEADRLDSEALARHLAGRGYSAQLNDIDRAAPKAGAPSLRNDVTLAAARSQWQSALSGIVRLSALEDALRTAKAALGDGVSIAEFSALKNERDALRRAVETGTIWTEGGSF
jgi:DNA primase